MSTVTVSFLSRRLLRADQRWSQAMSHPEYRDDPDEADAAGEPFTEADWTRYGFADAWRCLVHLIEGELWALPEVRHRLLEHSESDSGVVYFVAEAASATELCATSETSEPAEEPDPTTS